MSRKCRFLLNVKVKKIKYMKNLHFRLFLFIIILVAPPCGAFLRCHEDMNQGSKIDRRDGFSVFLPSRPHPGPKR